MHGFQAFILYFFLYMSSYHDPSLLKLQMFVLILCKGAFLSSLPMLFILPTYMEDEARAHATNGITTKDKELAWL